MAKNGFNNWIGEDDSADGSSLVCSRAEGLAHAKDLGIEKKRLQLVGIDAEKFDYFFDKYYNRIFDYAFWKTSNHDDAADVANEVFMLAWDRRRQFRWQGYSFGAWLFQIARSVVSHRDRKQVVQLETEYLPEHHDPVDETTPAEVLERKTDRELVRQCMECLSENQYEVIVLNRFVGMTVRQIALVTKMPQGSVSSHLRRGKRALLRCLEEYGATNVLSETAQQAMREAAVEDSGLKVAGGMAGSQDEDQNKD